MGKIDDPIAAAKNQIAMTEGEDDQFLGPLSRHKAAVKALVKVMLNVFHPPTLVSAAGSLHDALTAWREEQAECTLENQAYLLDTVVSLVSAHDEKLKDNSDRLGRLEDATSFCLGYVGPTTSPEKLGYFASIVVSGALIFHEQPLEQTDEFLRIANSLYPTDVMVLRELGVFQSSQTAGYVGDSQIISEMQMAWPSLLARLRESEISDASRKSALVRLQSFGLVERLEPNITATSPGDTPYILLEMGKQFLDYLRGCK
jgi:hypothetical protein